ncbi:MAG: AraC family transcriptional regulator [Alphaproteobacteria bacterium]|nr:AraC family transcriptional regulator [Alphaproteobacteria bacterium]
MTPSQPRCESCGMPLRSDHDHAGGNPSIRYCRHCAAPDGRLKSFAEVASGMTAFLVETQGMAPDAARPAAEKMLRTMPAWKR